MKGHTMNRIDYANLDFTQLSATQLDEIHHDAKARALELRREAMREMWNSIDDWIQHCIARARCVMQRNAH
jgi:hypothetical protein